MANSNGGIIGVDNPPVVQPEVITTFNSSGNFTKNPYSPNAVDILIVAGGGSGGGGVGGGGGAGGLNFNPNYRIPASAFPITIGAGGAGVTGTTVGNDGSNSVSGAAGVPGQSNSGSMTMIGGGGGGDRDSQNAGQNGGSGGGGAGTVPAGIPGGTATSGQAAIIGLGGYYAGGGFGRLEGGFNFKNIPGASFLMGGGKDGKYDGSFNPFKVGILGAAALPFFMKQPEDPDIGMSDRGGSLTDPLTGNPAKPAEMRSSLNTALANANGDPARIKQIQDAYAFLIPDERLGTYLPYRTYGVKDGGRIGKAEGGLMNLGGMEKDYRAEGGFVPIGREEKADDVPARLSVNEFVFTADAVRNAGGGDIDKGAEVMENMMKNLENGGTVSEESQGNTGAQQMFSVSERIGEVI